MEKRRVILSLIGYMLFGLSINMLLISDVALHPVDNVVVMISKVLPEPINTFSVGVLIFHSVFLIIILIFNSKLKAPKEKLILSFISVVISSISIEIFALLLGDLEITSNIKYVTFVVFFMTFMLGVYLYTICNFLTPTGDYSLFLFSTYTGKSLGLIRNIFDATMLAIAAFGLFVLKMDLSLELLSIVMALSGGYLYRLYNLVPYFRRIQESN